MVIHQPERKASLPRGSVKLQTKVAQLRLCATRFPFRESRSTLSEQRSIVLMMKYFLFSTSERISSFASSFLRTQKAAPSSTLAAKKKLSINSKDSIEVPSRRMMWPPYFKELFISFDLGKVPLKKVAKKVADDEPAHKTSSLPRDTERLELLLTHDLQNLHDN